jgi:SAM-dependent methyltransferase
MDTHMNTMLRQLHALCKKPDLYDKGTSNIWTDSYLQHGMLESHLDDVTDGASFPLERRRALVRFIDALCPAKAFPRVLDLGCGPGLIASAVARGGRKVTGIDFAPNSIAYAREQAVRDGLPVRYIVGNYVTDDLTLEEGEDYYDLVIMISYDFNVLPQMERAQLLEKVHQMLRPGGIFLLDVFTTNRQPARAESRRFETGSGGYWSQGDYLLLTQDWLFEGAVYCQQYILLDGSGVRTFNIWEHLFTPEELAHEITAAGFETMECYADHAGSAYVSDNGQLIVAARKWDGQENNM